MSKLEGFQKRYLRSLGHPLKPVVLIGKAGLTDGLLRKVRAELEAHELIKIRFGEFKSERHALTDEIAAHCGGQVVGLVGHTALLFRPNPEAERRRIRLPARGGSR